MGNNIIFKKNDFDFMPKPNSITHYEKEDLNGIDESLITCTYGFIFDENNNLLISLEGDRGWDLPGGHIENGESINKAFHREIKEEGGVTCKDVKLFCIAEMLVKSKDIPKDYKYPIPKSYMLYYVAKVDKILEFKPSEEDLDRKFFSLEELETTEISTLKNEVFQVLYKKAKEYLHK